MRIAIVYDCLYPETVGGAERWYRALADHLSKDHSVTYLTRRQWDKGKRVEASFDVIAVSSGGPLYTKSGRRRISQPLLFGLGVFFHLLRRGRHYDIVDCASFPYFSLLAAKAALLLVRSNAVLVEDWFECWTKEYWKKYLGALGGRIGYRVQRLCLRTTKNVITYSRLVEGRLRSEGYDGDVMRLTGLYTGATDEVETATPSVPPRVIYAGRHTPEKRVTAIPAAIAEARLRVPDLTCTVFGDGPERDRLLYQIEKLGLNNVIECPGFVDHEVIQYAMKQATCFLLPSEREGYGIVVVESAACGTPSVVTASANSAASELIVEGENGFIAASAEPRVLSEAILGVYEDGNKLRESTARWFSDNVDWLSVDRSVESAEDMFRRANRNMDKVS